MVELDAERAARWNDSFFGGLVGRAVNLSIGVLHAGDWASTVAGRAEMEGRLAFIPPQTMSDVRQEGRVARRGGRGKRSLAALIHRPTVEWIRYQGEPWRQDAAHPFVGMLGDVIAGGASYTDWHAWPLPAAWMPVSRHILAWPAPISALAAAASTAATNTWI